MTITPEAPPFMSPDFVADPHAAYGLMRDNTPLLWDETTGTYLISRFEDLRRIFRDPIFTTDHYAQSMEPIYGRTILQMSGHEHAVRRALVTPAFRGSLFQERYRAVIERNAGELIDSFRHTGRVDIVAEFARVFPVNVIADMLGFDKADHPRFQKWYAAIVDCFGNLSGDPEIAAGGVRTREELGEYIFPVIRDRREHPREDLLSDLCAAEVDGTTMSDEDIRAFASLLLVAGGETTDKAIGSLFHNLATHPEQLAAIRADRSLIPAALAETLRLTPPVQIIQRQVSEDVEIAGGRVTAGNIVTCLIGSANRDPRAFRNPDDFDIRRTDLSTKTAFTAAADHLAFSLGRHFCLGAMLSLAEVEVATNQLLDAMPDMRLAEGATVGEQGVFVRGVPTLPLEFTPVTDAS